MRPPSRVASRPVQCSLYDALGYAIRLQGASNLAPTAYFEPFAVGATLIDMPIFLTPDRYVNVPLAATYEDAWRGVPNRWKRVIVGDAVG